MQDKFGFKIHVDKRVIGMLEAKIINLKLRPLKFSLNHTLFLILFMVCIFSAIAIQYIYSV